VNNNVKKANGARILNLFFNNNLQNIFQSFKNVILYLKMQRLKTEEFKRRQIKMRRVLVV
jgi:hypothetical protein